MYFGFGANAHPEMMEALLDRTPIGTPAILRDHKLVIEHFEHMPAHAKEVIRQGGLYSDADLENFVSYAIHPSSGEEVRGMAWQIGAAGEVALTGVQTEILDSDGTNYEQLRDVPRDVQESFIGHFPVAKERLLEAAKAVRRLFIKRRSPQ